MNHPTRYLRLACFFATLTLSAVLLSACSESDRTPAPAGPAAIQMRSGAGLQDLADPLNLSEAHMDGSNLIVESSYAGGCRSHDFAAFADPDGFSRSDPPELTVYLRHQGGGDACRAIIDQTLTFDATAAVDEFQRRFGRTGPFVLRVVAPSGGEIVARSARHEGGPDNPKVPKDVLEADLMAMVLSGQVSPPEDLSNEVFKNLGDIRTRFADTAPEVEDIAFVAPWVESQIVIHFDAGTIDKVETNTYNAWNDLNTNFNLTGVDLRASTGGLVTLNFGRQLNPVRLSQAYAGLPGVISAVPNRTRAAQYNIYPRRGEDGFLTYLFRQGSGNCQPDCDQNQYWYFRMTKDGSASFVGAWDPQQLPESPDWWSEAKLNLDVLGN